MSDQSMKHPPALWTLFLSEMWERFCYYGMRALLALFLIESMMKGNSEAFLIYGAYTALVYAAPILCGWVGETYNWHYGFGLAAIGMFIGQITYFYGQKYLVGVGDFIGKESHPDRELRKRKLTAVEKDRVKVLLISFLLIIFFWGAFEQAGGLIDRKSG